jgi:ribosomal protein S12 methylthiotransferase
LGIWVRLHYVYPYPHVDDVIPLMAEGAILPYLDVPFQHASPSILKSMKRPASSENNLARIKAWREICPDITIRSTFIAGFPGETEDDFNMLLDFLEEAQLDRVGCFAYSAVDGAKANDLPNQVPEEVKQERLSRFMEVQERISAAKVQSKVGSMQTVLVDEITMDESDNIIAIGRTKADAPEIDGVVYLQDAEGLNPGDFVEVQILGADGHDLVGGPPQELE